jgi:uncharacterized LabA/DUF88 family protein
VPTGVWVFSLTGFTGVTLQFRAKNPQPRPFGKNNVRSLAELKTLHAMDCVWLIDMGYLTKASKGRGKVDYIATKKFLEANFKAPCLPIIFNSVDAYGVEFGLNQFYYTMKKSGFLVNLYPMEGGAQKQVDVAIGSHLVYYAQKGYHVVLSSGDIDFVPAITVARKDDETREVTLLTFNFGVHQVLSEMSTEHLLFEDYPAIIKS